MKLNLLRIEYLNWTYRMVRNFHFYRLYFLYVILKITENY